MRCPYCDQLDNRVLDSRLADDGHSIRRRRQCDGCGKRFTTYERAEEALMVVVKKDGRREKFDRRKLLNGLVRACEKRPVTFEQIETMAGTIEHQLRQKGESEITSDEVGQLVMDQLSKTDGVAYVRFASVYKEFKDVSKFAEELKILERLRETLQGREET